MQFSIEGDGEPLLLVHGIGGSSRVWRPLLAPLAGRRKLILPDLPGHGRSGAEPGGETFADMAARLEAFLEREGLARVDMVGFSLGGRLVLEMARRGRAGSVLALGPGGFWAGWERSYLRWTLLSSAYALRAFRGAVPALAHNAALRSALLAQLSARPWSADGDEVEAELLSFASTAVLPALVNDLASAPMQEGPAAPSTASVTIGWGRHDRLLFPVQAERARAAFPGAALHWFENSGHYVLWDEPDQVLDLIARAVG